MVDVAQGLALGGASRAFQAADERSIKREAIASQEKIAQSRISLETQKLALDSADAAILSLTGEIKETAALLAETEPGSRINFELNQRLSAAMRAAREVGAVYEKVGDPRRGAAALERLRIASQGIRGLAALKGTVAGAAEGEKAKAAGPGKAVAAGQKKSAELKARTDLMQKVMEDAGLSPQASSAAANDPVTAEAIQSPVEGGGPVSEDLKEVANRYALANAFFVAGMIPEANFQLKLGNDVMDNSPAIAREQELDKRISDSMAQILGMEPGVTYREARARLEASGQRIPSTAEVAEQRATGTALGKGRVDARGKVELIQQTQGIIRGLIDEFQGKGKFAGKPNPNLFGIRGSFASTGKKALAVISDLGLTGFVDQATDLVSETLTLDQIFEMTQSPTLSALDILQNTIGIVWANVRTKTGRVPLELIRKSIAEVKLTGLKGGQQVVDRLELVSKLIGGRGASLQRTFGLGGDESSVPSSVPRFRVGPDRLIPVQ